MVLQPLLYEEVGCAYFGPSIGVGNQFDVLEPEAESLLAYAVLNFG